jgi:preprotein translocase subunit SecF
MEIVILFIFIFIFIYSCIYSAALLREVDEGADLTGGHVGTLERQEATRDNVAPRCGRGACPRRWVHSGRIAAQRAEKNRQHKRRSQL